MQLWVLLFNTDSENQGIYSLSVGDKNVILAFEDEDDAIRYAGLLEAQDFPNPVVEKIEQEEIEAFCQEAGYDFNIVAEGELAIPPVQNVEETDWQPDLETQSAEISEIERMRRRLEGLL